MKNEEKNMEMCKENKKNIFAKIRKAIFNLFHKNHIRDLNYQDSNSDEIKLTEIDSVNKEENIKSLNKKAYNSEGDFKPILKATTDDAVKTEKKKNTYREEFFKKYNNVKSGIEDIDDLSLKEQLQIWEILKEEVAIKEKSDDEKKLDKQIEQLRAENEKLEKELKKLEAEG